MPLPDAASLAHAQALVQPVVPRTPTLRWATLCQRLGLEIRVKHENHTPLGAFKIRGGLVYMADLAARQPEVAGVIAATRGNHGQSIAFAAARAGLVATIVVPHGNSREKNQAMRALGARLVEHGEDFQAALEHARTLAEAEGLHPVPSFDERLVAGVATYGLEFLEDAPDLDTVYVPIGLGSGLCGVAAARAALGRRVRLVGVVSEGAPAYARSLAGGEIVSAPVTTRLGDGMACRTPAPEAFEIIRQEVDRIVTVDDAALAEAMRILFSDTHNAAEGAGAAGLAAVMAERDRLAGQTVGVVLCGANVDRDVFARVLAGADA
jgi:threonine dehydratase